MNRSSVKNEELSIGALAFALFICALFGSNAVAIKISLEGLGVFTNVGFRFVISAVAISSWAYMTGRSFRLPPGGMKDLVVIACIFAVQLSLFNLGLSMTNASRATLIVNLQPFLVVFFAHFFIPGDAFNKRKFLGIVVGFAGVLVLLIEGRTTDWSFQVGDLLVLGGAGLWAVNAVYTKRVIDKFAPFQVALYPMLMIIPVFFLQGFLFDRSMVTHLDGRVFGAMMFQGIASGAFGFVAWNTLFARYGAVNLNSLVFIIPVIGVWAGWLFLDEPISRSMLLCLGFIVAGMLIVHLHMPGSVSLGVGRRGD